MQPEEKRPLGVKLLAIVGFSATILIIGWALFMLVSRGDELFASLSARLEHRESATPTTSVSPAPEEPEAPTDEVDEDVAVTTPQAEPATTPTPTTPATPPRTQTLPLVVDTGHRAYVDLAIRTLGVARLTSAISSVQVDVGNVGTITSAPWSFTTTLPDGSVYASPLQAPLRVEEHALFSIQYETRGGRGARVESIVYTAYDTNTHNNISTYSY